MSQDPAGFPSGFSAGSQKSIVTLGSGHGSTIEFFCRQIQRLKERDGVAPFIIKVIVTDNPRSRLLNIAQKFKIPCHVLPYDKENPNLWDENLCQILNSYDPSLIALAGFLKKIGPKVIKSFPNKILNSHPALLPKFGGPGFYGLKVHQAVLKAGEKQTGLSIHFVDSEYDKGPVLRQLFIPIQEKDSPEDLEKRVKEKEKPFYFQTLAELLSEKVLND